MSSPGIVRVVVKASKSQTNTIHSNINLVNNSKNSQSFTRRKKRREINNELADTNT